METTIEGKAITIDNVEIMIVPDVWKKPDEAYLLAFDKKETSASCSICTVVCCARFGTNYAVYLQFRTIGEK